MKRIHILSTALLISAACATMSCDDNDPNLSKAVLTSASSLTFEASEAPQQMITVYADAEWIMEDLPEWIQVSPTTGTGTLDVTITATDNLRDGTLDNPRQATLVFRGSTLASRATVLVKQAGDKYRDCQEYTLSQLADLADETVVSVPQAWVTALTTTGAIVTDQQHHTPVLIHTTAPLRLGDRLSLKGTKHTDSRKLVYLNCDEATATAHNQPVQRGEALDITGQVDRYTATTRAWISVTGVLQGNTLSIEGADNQVTLTDAPASLGLQALNGHRVRVDGYFNGVAAPVLRLTAAQVHDLGVVEEIYFSEDFEWLNPWSELSQAGQTVENDGDGSAPQVYTAKNAEGITAADALTQRGYVLEQTPGNAIYLQKNYLKFGKTDFQAGLTLPAIDGVPAHTALQLSFDWAPMVGGTRKFDPVKVIVTITNGNQVTELEPLEHSFVDTQDHLTWLHADLRLEGIPVTKDTRISIKSDAWGENKGTTGSSVYRRWFIDNIKLTKAK